MQVLYPSLRHFCLVHDCLARRMRLTGVVVYGLSQPVPVVPTVEFDAHGIHLHPSSSRPIHIKWGKVESAREVVDGIVVNLRDGSSLELYHPFHPADRTTLFEEVLDTYLGRAERR